MSTQAESATPGGRVLVEVAEGVGWVTVSNPARYNALNLSMVESLPRLLAALDADPAVKVVVVRGDGDKAFISGADISEFGDRRTAPGARDEYEDAMSRMWGAWIDLGKPVVAMISGFCLGGGLMTAVHADIRVAASGSRFGIPAARLGVGFAGHYVHRLAALVGPANAADLLFTARRLAADEALAMGLVNRVVAPERLGAEVADITGAIVRNAPLTMRAAKAALRELLPDARVERPGPAAELVRACFDSADYVEGQRAFLDKRDPVFQGR